MLDIALRLPADASLEGIFTLADALGCERRLTAEFLPVLLNRFPLDS